MTRFLIVCGTRNSGKTSWVCALTRALVGSGLVVDTIKHTHHGHDVEGKDTHRHQDAGAANVMLVSDSGTALFRKWTTPQTLAELVDTHFPSSDLVLVEGYRSEPHAKLIVGDDPGANREHVVGCLPVVEDGVVKVEDLQRALRLIDGWLNRQAE